MIEYTLWYNPRCVTVTVCYLGHVHAGRAAPSVELLRARGVRRARTLLADGLDGGGWVGGWLVVGGRWADCWWVGGWMVLGGEW